MKKDVEEFVANGFDCKCDKTTSLPHVLYTPSPVTQELWVNVSMYFILTPPRTFTTSDSIFVVGDVPLKWLISLLVIKWMIILMWLNCSLESL